MPACCLPARRARPVPRQLWDGWHFGSATAALPVVRGRPSQFAACVAPLDCPPAGSAGAGVHSPSHEIAANAAARPHETCYWPEATKQPPVASPHSLAKSTSKGTPSLLHARGYTYLSQVLPQPFPTTVALGTLQAPA
ncbi:hypothetical protein IQ07DRAFT_594302 [Pyrenochaeta sp. DS3sAY3a]|nr:hypothetical protein IQ07DRAFT_594302 [Pyrenochaeta sp. DS3sAY3a]